MSRKPNPVPVLDHIDPEKGANWRAISQSWNQRRVDAAIARVLGTKKKEDGDE